MRDRSLTENSSVPWININNSYNEAYIQNESFENNVNPAPINANLSISPFTAAHFLPNQLKNYIEVLNQLFTRQNEVLASENPVRLRLHRRNKILLPRELMEALKAADNVEGTYDSHLLQTFTQPMKSKVEQEIVSVIRDDAKNVVESIRSQDYIVAMAKTKKTTKKKLLTKKGRRKSVSSGKSGKSSESPDKDAGKKRKAKKGKSKGTRERDEEKTATDQVVMSYRLSDLNNLKNGITAIPDVAFKVKIMTFRAVAAKPYISCFRERLVEESIYYKPNVLAAIFNTNGTGIVKYPNGGMAIEIDQGRLGKKLVIYSESVKDELGNVQESVPLAIFDDFGNGAVFDMDGNISNKPKREVVLSVVVCGDRVQETLVMIKSAIALSQESKLRLIVIAEEKLIQDFEEKLTEWKNMLNGSFIFETRPVSFPKNGEDEWKKLFKPCASQRLFLPSVLVDVDSVLYVDTDVLFLSPPETVWRHFDLMNSSQLAALAPEHEDPNTGWYNRFARHPYYGKLGVNSGVMLMNLTRMREFGWEKYLVPILKEYKLKMTWGDQDIINIIFHYHPESLYIYDCSYNYRSDHCMYSSVCKTAHTHGVKVIHGSRGTFHTARQPTFRAVFQAFQEYQLVSDMYQYLYLPMEFYLKQTTNTNCGKVYNIFLKQVKEFVGDGDYFS